MADTEFQLNDAVTVETKGGGIEKGKVAYLGPVQFAGGNDWIGIILTGPSEGKGKNNGTVKDVKYFETYHNNGMFVRSSNVKKNAKASMSKVEELRLRRAQNSMTGPSRTGITSSRASMLKSPTKSASNPSSAADMLSRLEDLKVVDLKSELKSRGMSTTGLKGELQERLRLELSKEANSGGSDSSSEALTKNETSTKNGTSGDTAKTATSDRLAELKARREALAKSRTAGNVTPGPKKIVDPSKEEEETDAATPSLQHATPGYRAELTRLNETIKTLQMDLKKKETENASLQSSLDFMSKGAEQSTHDAVRMYAMGALLAAGGTPGKSPGPGGRRSLDAELKEESEEEGNSSHSDEESEEEEEQDREEAVAAQAAAAVSQALVQRNDELTAQLSELNAKNSELHNQLSEAEERMSNYAFRLEQSQDNYQSAEKARSDEMQGFTADKAVMTSQIQALERELKILQDRVSEKSSSQDASHVTLAKLRAELTSLQRRNDDLESDKLQLESTLEELVLDKEAIGQEKEMLEEMLEECKVDLESAQLELEDAKSQLEDDHNTLDGISASADLSEGETGQHQEDVVRSLNIQNTRLRTALIRLREQSELERNELQRQLRSLQSDATSKEAMQAELDTLRASHSTAQVEMQELKDIIDQTTSLEETIETLSDKVWNLEEQNANLERTVREMEEAAEIAAEMEEVQADELKIMMRDLEGRDALVKNLEEAIRMQRRREDDFQRYILDFRTSISNLKQEKQALLAITEGNQGEKSHLMATSQKALTQAAQLAADAAEARKRSSEVAFKTISARSATYLSQRLESLLPSGVVATEVTAVKGELSLAMLADKAAASLSAVEEVFNKAIDKGALGISEFNTLAVGETMPISDAASEQISTMSHQAEFASMVIDASSDSLRLLAAGQWPDLLTHEVSSDIGNVIIHSIAELDSNLSDQLKLLKQEGVLSPLRSSLADLKQSIHNTRLAIFATTDEAGNLLIPENWAPPGLQALKSLSAGRFSLLGAVAVVSSSISPIEDDAPIATPRNIGTMLSLAKQNRDSILGICRAVSGLQLNDDETLDSLNHLAGQYAEKSSTFADIVKTSFVSSVSEDNVQSSMTALEDVSHVARQLSALIRRAELDENVSEKSRFHYLSPEFGDSWKGLTEAVSQFRGVDGDPEDVNFLTRAREIEHQLSEAVENVPKLAMAESKITRLEKSLSSRTKEIAIQNARIHELEGLVSKVPTTSVSAKTTSVPTDTSKLEEEVRTLTEALDVMSAKNEDYEKAMKSKSRVRQSLGGRTPSKKSAAADLESTINQLGQASSSKTSRDILLESISLEAALYRPALHSAAQSASYWKSKAIGSALSQLTPLNVSPPPGDGIRASNELALAHSQARLTNASYKVVDLSKKEPARSQFNAELAKCKAAEARLRDANCLFWGPNSASQISTQ